MHSVTEAMLLLMQEIDKAMKGASSAPDLSLAICRLIDLKVAEALKHYHKLPDMSDDL